MACGECGDPRNLCRCEITAADSSVVITGDGSDLDPYQISAPGAGSGTRAYDRAGVYDDDLSGDYPTPLPPDYPHLDFYGPADPRTVPGYAPTQFDGWYAATHGALIGLRHSGPAQESPTGTSCQVLLPTVADGDVAVLTLAAAGGTLVPAPGWAQVAAVPGPPLTAVYYRVCTAADSGGEHDFTGLDAPVGGYLQVYSGVDPQVLDVAASTAFTPAPAASMTIPGLTVSTPGALLLSAATIDATSTQLVPPAGMSTVQRSSGTTYRHLVASQLQAGPGPSGDRLWTHQPAPPLQRYSGVLLSLRPAPVVDYRLWINGAWTPVGSTGGAAGGGGGGDSSYRTTIGDGVASAFTVVHPLGTTDLTVECVNLETGQTCWPVIRRTGTDTVYLDFGDTVPAPDSRRVLMRRG